MLRRTLLWASENRWLRERGTRFRLARRAVRRFMPGERLEDALEAAESFALLGIGTVLTELGENVAQGSEADGVAVRYAAVLDRVAARALDAELSVKLTQLGLDLDPAMALRHVRSLAGRAAERGGGTLWIDMEGRAYTDATLELYRRSRESGDALGVCLQAYLHRTPADLEALLPLSPSIRLVKGAYAEPPAAAHTARRDVDDAFLRLSRRLLAALAAGEAARVAFATHDLELIRRIREEASAAGVADDAIEFQMLYGIQRDAQRRLAADGCRVRVLISYGSAWYPWFVRRLAEKPTNIFLVASG